MLLDFLFFMPARFDNTSWEASSGQDFMVVHKDPLASAKTIRNGRMLQVNQTGAQLKILYCLWGHVWLRNESTQEVAHYTEL